MNRWLVMTFDNDDHDFWTPLYIDVPDGYDFTNAIPSIYAALDQEAPDADIVTVEPNEHTGAVLVYAGDFSHCIVKVESIPEVKRGERYKIGPNADMIPDEGPMVVKVPK